MALFAGTMLCRLSIIMSYVVSINLVTFCAYGYDKTISASRWVRVPEALLHGFALAGGSPGAWLAQRLFRHKTVKSRFQIIYWLIVGIQLMMIVMAGWWINR